MAEIDPNESWLSDDYRNQLGGPPMVYVDSPDAYHEGHQVNSVPTDFTKFYGGVDGEQLLDVPLRRLLPPGSEQPAAQFAAERKLFSMQNPERNSVWRIIGIRPEFQEGMWINQVRNINSDFDELNTDIDAPLNSVLFDFMAQETALNGVMNMTRESRNAKAGDVSSGPSRSGSGMLGVRK